MSNPPNNKVWFITGISRGLGQALATATTLAGDYVVGTTRNGRVSVPNNRLAVMPLDLASLDDIESTIAAAHAIHGRLDVIVNNAGYGLLGPVEHSSAAEVANLFTVNFHAPLRIVQAALPFLRTQGFGHIVNVTSIAALDPLPGSAIYAASKAALDALSLGLAREVESLDLRVTAVAPGGFRTEFLSNSSIRQSAFVAGQYPSVDAVLTTMMNKAGKQSGDPQRAAAIIRECVYAEHPPRTLVLGNDAMRRVAQRQAKMTEEVEGWCRDAQYTR